MAIANNTSFGIVTVMDVKAYDVGLLKTLLEGTRAQADAALVAKYNSTDSADAPLCFIDHMQVATLSTDGPSITINGGKYNNALLKYGKTARCEMTDALGQPDALAALGGAEWDDNNRTLIITDKFSAPVILIGHSFVVDKESGRHIPVHVILYQFLPDSTPSFAFDSGNAATFDLNGDLLAVEFKGDAAAGNECPEGNGVFFSFVFDDCTLPGGNSDKYVELVYGGTASGPVQAKVGDEITLKEGERAENLITGAAIPASNNKITLADGMKRVLITSIAAGE